MKKTQVIYDILTIVDDLVSKEECERLIKELEAIKDTLPTYQG